MQPKDRIDISLPLGGGARPPNDSSDSAASAGYVRPIPEALYPCVHCAEDYSWPASDLNWSDVDEGWVCDMCWDDRETNWDGDDYIEKDKGISLAEEIKRRT
jgi:hypothetical protein